VLALLRTAGPVRRFLLASMQSSVGNAIGYVALLLLAYERRRRSAMLLPAAATG
jgi:uncharacterized membrane protein YeiB